MNIHKFILLYICAAQVCCHKGDPLQSLPEDKFSDEYNVSFWLHESSTHSSLWLQAKQICSTEKNISKPNCRQVRAAASLARESIALKGFTPDNI